VANMRLATATRNALADKIDDLINAGAAGGTIKIYTATQPASANTAISDQTLLATLTFAEVAFGAASAGVITAETITEDAAADADGTAAWARIADSDGNTIFDCDVGVSGATINLNTVNLVTGGPVSITSFTITMPSGEAA
jgi:hypothetical protein